jgi:hypothetical protein
VSGSPEKQFEAVGNVGETFTKIFVRSSGTLSVSYAGRSTEPLGYLMHPPSSPDVFSPIQVIETPILQASVTC